MKNENGVISLFVLFAMIFLLVFSLCVYFGIKNRLNIQEYKTIEMQEIYSRSGIEKIENAETNELIPIYNIDTLNIAGTGRYIKINNKIYECGIGRSYIFKDDIIVDIEEDIMSKRIEMNEYKLYSKTHYIDKNSYELSYYKDGAYWDLVVYQKFSEENNALVRNGRYLPNEFCDFSKIKSGDKDILLIWNDEVGTLSNNIVKKQMISEITNINQINVFVENNQKIDKTKGEYYIFVKK